MNKQFKNKHFIPECKRLIRVSLFSLYAAVAFNTNSSIAAPTGKLESWRFSPQGSQLEISLSAPSRPQYFYLSQPPRIVVDLPDTKLGYVPTQQTYNGAIQRIRVSQLNKDVTRIVMDLAPGTFFDRNQVQLKPVSWQNPTRWVFNPLVTNNFLPAEYESVGGELPPGAYPSQLPPGTYPSQLPNNSFYSPQPPGAISPLQPQPGILPPGNYNNPSQLPPGIVTPPTSFTTPLPLPSTDGNIAQPNVVVPPITIRNPTINPSLQMPNSVLPPARFSSPSFIPVAPSNMPTNSEIPSDSGVIEFGQPFPTPTQ